MDSITIEFTDAEAGQRIDKALSTLCESLSRARIQQLIGEGQCQLDGVTVANPAQKVKSGQRATVTIPQIIEPENAKPQAIALNIVFEDAHILVLNKPVGLTVHPAPGHADGTLVNALLHHCGDSLSGIGGVARPGIVHRLDKDTSGLMVVAKHDAAHQHLAAQLKERTLKRTYAACVWGVPQPPHGTVDAAIDRSRNHRQKMAVVKQGGREAVTHYELIERFQCYQPKIRAQAALFSLLHCHLQTGRTHQIRVHMAHIGHSIIGDPTYGTGMSSKIGPFRTVLSEETVRFLENLSHQALFALRLTLVHPVTGESMEFEAPLPDWMETLLYYGRHLPKSG